MTATVPPPAITTEAPTEPLRRLSISVNLLPDEVKDARAARSARKMFAGVLAASLVATGGWYYHARSATDAANGQLTQAQDESAAALRAQRSFGPLKTTKAQIATKRSSLAAATKGDVAWSRLLPELHQVLPAGVSITSITATATVNAQVPPTAGGPATASSGLTGSIVLTGTAASKDSVSSFSLRLSLVPGLVNAQITNVQIDSQSKKVTFGIQVSTTSKALSTRYAKAGK